MIHVTTCIITENILSEGSGQKGHSEWSHLCTLNTSRLWETRGSLDNSSREIKSDQNEKRHFHPAGTGAESWPETVDRIIMWKPEWFPHLCVTWWFPGTVHLFWTKHTAWVCEMWSGDDSCRIGVQRKNLYCKRKFSGLLKLLSCKSLFETTMPIPGWKGREDIQNH